MKRIHIGIVLALLPLVLAAACGVPGLTAAGESTADSLCSHEYFPVAKGNTWEYRITVHQPDVADLVVYQLSEIVEVTSNGFTVLPNVSQTGEFEPVPNPAGKYVQWSCLPEGLFLQGEGREGITIARTMQPGATWKTTEPGSDYEILYAVQGSEQVKVPAGTFEALKVRVDDGGEGQNIFKWYAPGVGVVREFAEFVDLDTWTLIELTAHSASR